MSSATLNPSQAYSSVKERDPIKKDFFEESYGLRVHSL